MTASVRIVTVDAANLEREGFFCYKSKRDTEGYGQKRAWAREGFPRGPRVKILYEGDRQLGFIEYVPGEYTWRAVKAAGYFVIHCMWVIGSGKGTGYGGRLLRECVREAKRAAVHGVAMVTSSQTWLAGSRFLIRHGFTVVDQAPPCFELLVKQFDDADPPSFPTNWGKRQAAFGAGITIVRSSQCPYVEASVRAALAAASELGLPARVVDWTSPRQARQHSPTPYGVFAVLHDGQVLTYHPLAQKDFIRRMRPHLLSETQPAA